ncbi:MAG: hypothetical protein IJS50_03675 [Desulfovibrio sp.]|nr:hypothetical protein [Desulfovibrio sp.]
MEQSPEKRGAMEQELGKIVLISPLKTTSWPPNTAMVMDMGGNTARLKDTAKPTPALQSKPIRARSKL